MLNLSLIEDFIYCFLHPYRIHEYWRHRIPLPGIHHTRDITLTIGESLAISWMFAIIKAIIQVLFIYILAIFFRNFILSSFPIAEMYQVSGLLSPYYIFVISLILDIIFFPVMTFIMAQFWMWLIKFYGKYLDESESEKKAEEIITVALTTHVFYLVPIIGEFLQKIFFMFYIYAGLRKNLGANRVVSLLIIFTPIFLTIAFFSFIALSIFYLVSKGI